MSKQNMDKGSVFLLNNIKQVVIIVIIFLTTPYSYSYASTFDVIPQTSGAATSLSLTAVISVDDKHIGSNGVIFIAGIYQSEIFVFNGSYWTSWDSSVSFPYAYSGILNTQHKINLFSSVDVSVASGAVFFAGYGESFEEMTQQERYKAFYTIPEIAKEGKTLITKVNSDGNGS
ncbi:MAG: hypothetical protein HQK69_09285, partial [Desulfamplus sp.]|nr:hypothetical protein [Desulfamplus sp.]